MSSEIVHMAQRTAMRSRVLMSRGSIVLDLFSDVDSAGESDMGFVGGDRLARANKKRPKAGRFIGLKDVRITD